MLVKIVILIVAVVGGVFFLLSLMKAKEGPDIDAEGKGSDYEALRTILSPAESAFLAILAPAVPDGVGVLVKIRLADIFMARRGLDPARRAAAINRLSRKHVDFLLVRAADFSPLAGIDLRDAGGRNSDRKASDRFVESVFTKNGLPFVRMLAQDHYDSSEVRAQLTAILTSAPR